MHAYGACVASKVPSVEQGMCEKEFMALKQCARAAMSEHVRPCCRSTPSLPGLSIARVAV